VPEHLRLLLPLAIAFCASTVPAAQVGGDRLANPSFEIDADGDGLPDGWSIHRAAKGSLVEEGSHGKKATRFTEGYVVLSQNLAIEDLADKTVRISIDAASPDGAKLGAYLGFRHAKPEGKWIWRNHRLCWDRALSGEYKTFRLQRRIASDALGPRLWVAFYRSNRAGTLTLDNVRFSISSLAPDAQKKLNRIEREWRYLRKRASSAKAADIVAQAREAEDRCFMADAPFEDDGEELRGRLSARVNRLVSPGHAVTVSFADPYRRLDPDELVPPEPVREEHLVAVAGEWHAVGLLLANGADGSVQCRIDIAGLPAEQFGCMVRKQASLETWYRKENERLSDPLPRLPRRDAAWQLTLTPGEIAKLYVGIQCLRGPADARATIRLSASTGQKVELPLHISVLPGPKPELPEFGHLSCIYTNRSVAAHSPELTAADLGAHGVNMIEFAFAPPCTFSPDGKLLEIDFSTQEKWLEAYGPHVERMAIFYAPAYGKFMLADGTAIERYTGPWNSAFVSLIGGLLDHAKHMGYGVDRFAMWTSDEPHSATLAASPDQQILDVVKVMKLCRQNFPDLPQVITLTYYAFPKDVAAMAPYIDVAVPHWPFRTQLKKTIAPSSYNPRRAFAEEMWPMLEAERQRRGMKIWSYHVAAGKTDDVLVYNRAYPIRAVGAGQTGICHWAYNVQRGSTWDDTDGGGVDYIFVYDGKEDHPTNRRLNPTGEVVVPSIRWEAVRAGIQDARLLLWLKEALASGRGSPDVRAQTEKLLRRVEALAKDDALITWDATAEISREVRRLYMEAGRTR